MKKILIGLLLLIGITASAQRYVMKDGSVVMHNGVRVYNVAESGGGYTTEYQALLDVWSVDPSGDTLTWQNALIDSLVTNGYWARMDLLLIFAQNDSTNAKVNWIDPGNHTALGQASGGVLSFTQYEGFTGDGTNSYIDLNYSLRTDSVNVSRISLTGGCYIRTQASAPRSAFGIQSSTQFWVHPAYTGSGVSSARNLTTSSDTYGSGTQTGTYFTTRRAAAETEFYNNGSSVDDGTANTTLLPTGNLFALARSRTTYADEFFDGQVSIVFIMDGISDAEATAINTIFETYMDAISKGVQ